jgi:myo-inositol-1(or 4)-monophosphatase
MKRILVACLRGAGRILLGYFGRVTHPRKKESASSIVCDADLAAEEYVLRCLQREFPDHNIISEESGGTFRDSDYTWVIDPLDGTSNFVAGLPWFGVQIGLLKGSQPILAGMYLPIERTFYTAEAGGGAERNGAKVQVSSEKKLENVLCAFGFDPAPARRDRERIELLFRVSQGVRNTRATNSLVDFCFTIDGRLGGCINLKTKIWDIVPASLILPEAGGKFTNLTGKPIQFQLDAQAPEREYAVLGASPMLHAQLLRRMWRRGR